MADRAPENDEIEVALLGRGYGEAVVIHAGDGDWISIDSFTTAAGPASLSYLASLGISPLAIQVILATHWHDDHVKGISDIYEAAHNADFYCSLAFRKDEFAAFVANNKGETVDDISSGVAELQKISLIKRRANRRPIITADAAKTIFLRQASQRSFNQRIELIALSPSPFDVQEFLTSLAAGVPSGATRIPDNDRNPASVAAWAQFGDTAALLGADLEESSAMAGWSGVLQSRMKPATKATLFKVPHHGSANAHNPGIWSDLLEADPISALAPWNRGRGLPRDSDVTRLKSYTSRLYTAKAQTTISFASKPAVVSKAIAGRGAHIDSLPKSFGVVRCRKKVAASAWSVELIGDAKHL